MNCVVCASELPPGAMFCGECGSSVSAKPRPAVVREAASDTSVVPPIAAPAQPGPAGEGVFPPASSGQSRSEQRRSEKARAGKDRPEQERPEQERPEQKLAKQERIQLPAGLPAGTPAYLLRFSTGETAAISGPGLIGRNPVAQPDEQIPTLIPITDEERSVSKTHLEVGVVEDRMWVSDRFSANGSMRIDPSGSRRRLEPGRRYLIEAGTRIAIGEQWVEFVNPESIGI